jgi:hypothetical protein
MNVAALARAALHERESSGENTLTRTTPEQVAHARQLLSVDEHAASRRQRLSSASTRQLAPVVVHDRRAMIGRCPAPTRISASGGAPRKLARRARYASDSAASSSALTVAVPTPAGRARLAARTRTEPR